MSESTCGGGCCCQSSGSSSGCCHSAAQPDPTRAQKEFLRELALQQTLPVTRFFITSDRSDHVSILALAPVYLQLPTDDMQTVKAFGAFLEEMEDAGWINLEYGEELPDYPYLEYTTSSLFAYLQETVQEAGRNPDFLGNTAFLERGSITITARGTRVLSGG